MLAYNLRPRVNKSENPQVTLSIPEVPSNPIQIDQGPPETPSEPSQANSEAPKKAPEAPKKASKAPKKALKAPHGGNKAPHGGNMAPDGGNKAPDGGNMAPHGGNKASERVDPLPSENIENQLFLGKRTTENSRATGTANTDQVEMAKPLDRVPVTLNDLQIAEELLIRAIQSRYFHKEIKTLLRLGVSEPNSIHELKEKSSGLLSLSPFLDKKGIKLSKSS